MSKQARHGEVVALTSRKGEGVLIDISPSIVPRSDGTTVTTATINLADAPVPTRRYVADACSVTYENDRLKLLFAQRRLGSGSFRSLVIISMSARGGQQFLDSLDRITETTLADLIKATDIKPASLVPINDEPDQTIELVANMLATAFSGREACLDFYDASPFAMAHAKGTNKLAIEPVVRIDIASSWLLAIVDRVRELQPQFPADVKLEAKNARI